MRVGTFGKFTIISSAIKQGDRWGAAFKVRIEGPNYDTVDLLEETFLDETFPLQSDAEEAAFLAGTAEARQRLEGKADS